MSETIFSKIIRGEILCHRVYEDGHVLAFLDINPVSRGHTLVIPKQPAAQVHELTEEAAAAVGRAVTLVARAVVRATGCAAYNVLQNNGAGAHQAVMHVHYHIIPKYGDGSGLGIVWRPGKLAEGEKLAREIGGEVGR